MSQNVMGQNYNVLTCIYSVIADLLIILGLLDSKSHFNHTEHGTLFKTNYVFSFTMWISK